MVSTCIYRVTRKHKFCQKKVSKSWKRFDTVWWSSNQLPSIRKSVQNCEREEQNILLFTITERKWFTGMREWRILPNKWQKTISCKVKWSKKPIWWLESYASQRFRSCIFWFTIAREKHNFLLEHWWLVWIISSKTRGE